MSKSKRYRNGYGYDVTPAPANLSPGTVWREIGSHDALTPAGVAYVCRCGPANHITGPQFSSRDGGAR